MNVQIKTLLIIGGMIASLGTGYWIGAKLSLKPVQVSEPVTKVLRTPGSEKEYVTAFMSPITIYTDQRGDCIHVVADDTYKETSQTFCFPAPKNMITVGAGYGISGPAALGMYQRKIVGDVWAGGQTVVGEGYAAIFVTASLMW